MGETGTIAFAGAARERAAVEIAGALAEMGVTRLSVNDPRACRSWELAARAADLPRELLGLAPGATIAGEGVAMMIDEGVVRWVADAAIAERLRTISPGADRRP